MSKPTTLRTGLVAGFVALLVVLAAMWSGGAPAVGDTAAVSRVQATFSTAGKHTVTCPTGGYVTGGGYWAGGSGEVYASYPDTPRSWSVVYRSAGTHTVFAICTVDGSGPPSTTPPRTVTVSHDAYYGKTCASAVSGVEAQVSSYDIAVSSTRRANPNAGVEPGQAYELSKNPVPAGTSVTVYCLPEDPGTPSPNN